jgi:hypothetical protein
MQVDVLFEFGKWYNITKGGMVDGFSAKFDVVKGQKFKIVIDSHEKIVWGSVNDAVLSLTEFDAAVDIEALLTGQSVIFIMNAKFGTLEQFDINVVDVIDEPAKDLGLTAGEVTPKV